MVRVAGLMGWKEERGAECTGVINEQIKILLQANV